MLTWQAGLYVHSRSEENIVEYNILGPIHYLPLWILYAYIIPLNFINFFLQIAHAKKFCHETQIPNNINLVSDKVHIFSSVKSITMR